jgi:hypothetical protein
VRTGVRRPLKALTRTLQAITLDARLYLDPSPDGKWILVHDRVANFGFQAVSLDGLKTVTWDRPDGGNAGFLNVCWLTSSQQWVLLSSNPKSVHLSIYSLDNPKSIQRSKVSGLAIRVSEYLSVLAGTDKDRLFTLTRDVTMMKSIFRQVDVRSGMGSPCPVPLSSRDQLVYVSASRDRSRLAWVVSRRAGPAMPSFLAWLPPVFQTEQVDQAVLFVTASDGSNPQEIGRMPLSNVMDGVNDTGVRISDLHWTPSGKYLSFEYNDKLWQVPIP